MTDLTESDFEATYRVLESMREADGVFDAQDRKIINDVHYDVQLYAEAIDQ